MGALWKQWLFSRTGVQALKCPGEHVLPPHGCQARAPAHTVLMQEGHQCGRRQRAAGSGRLGRCAHATACGLMHILCAGCAFSNNAVDGRCTHPFLAPTSALILAFLCSQPLPCHVQHAAPAPPRLARTPMMMNLATALLPRSQPLPCHVQHAAGGHGDRGAAAVPCHPQLHNLPGGSHENWAPNELGLSCLTTTYQVGRGNQLPSVGTAWLRGHSLF